MNVHLRDPNKNALKHLDKLFFNHMDAWGVTAVIVATALSIHQLITPKNLLLLIAITATYWFGFAVNDFFDRHHDKFDEQKAKRNFFLEAPYSPTLIHVAFVLIGLLLACCFMLFGWRSLLMFLIGGFIIWAYSAPPLRIKSRPILDLLVHGIFVETFPFYLVLVILNVNWLAIDIVILLALFFASFSSQLEQQARDIEVDSINDHNFTIQFGILWNQRLMKASTIMLILTIGYGLFSGIIPLIYSPFAVIMMPLLMHRFFRDGRPRSEQGVKLLTAVAIMYALFLIVFTGGA